MKKTLSRLNKEESILKTEDMILLRPYKYECYYENYVEGFFVIDGKYVVICNGCNGEMSHLDIRYIDSYKLYKSYDTDIDTSETGISFKTCHKNIIYAGTTEGEIYVWDIFQAKRLYTLRGHTEEISSISIRDNEIISISRKTIKAWDKRTHRCIRSFDLPGKFQFFGGLSEDYFISEHYKEPRKENSDFYTLNSDNLDYITIWNIDNFSKLSTIKKQNWDNEFDPNSLSRRMTTTLIDENNILIISFRYTFYVEYNSAEQLFLDKRRNRSREIEEVTIIWDIRNDKKIYQIGERCNFGSIFEKMGNYFVYGQDIWDITTGDYKGSLKSNTDNYAILSMYKLNNQILITRDGNNTLIMWDITNKKLLRVFNEHHDIESIFASRGDYMEINHEGRYLISLSTSIDGSQVILRKFEDDGESIAGDEASKNKAKRNKGVDIGKSSENKRQKVKKEINNNE